MTLAEALTLAEAAGVTVAMAGDAIRWRSGGPPPPAVLAALRAAKPELVALLGRYVVSGTDGLIGDDLLDDLMKLGFRVRRYGQQAALDDDMGLGRVPPMPLLRRFADKQSEYGLALRALSAPDALSAFPETLIAPHPSVWASVARPAVMSFWEFFCGGGVVRFGFGTNNWRCTFANDNDPRKCASYIANFGDQEIVRCDVADLTTSRLPGAAALAWMSPPCQDLSEAGAGAGLDGSHSSAFWPCWRLVEALRAEQRQPRVIAYENVPGLLSGHGGRDFDAVCEAFANAGYRIGALIVDAALFLPQSRPRVFVIAIDKATPIPADLTIGGPRAPFHPPELVAALRRQNTQPIWWRLPTPPARNSFLIDILDDEPNGVHWNTQAETDRIIGMMAPIHLARVEAMKRAGKRMVGALYRRTRDVSRWEIRDDGIAGCLRMPTGGSSRQTILIIEGALVKTRLLSAREAARLMGLPESYRLPTNYNEGYGLAADGVAVPVVHHLAEYLFEPLLQSANRLATE